MLITGIKDGREVTCLYQFLPDVTELRYLGELTADGKSVYKSIVDKNLCIYAVKSSNTNEFEHRYLYATEEYKIIVSKT